MSRNRYTLDVRLTTATEIGTTTLTAALALALESEAIKEIGSVDVEAIEVNLYEESDS